MVKQRIIEEASRLFVRSGVKSTMDDLARHMGISKRTIYENFKDKEELLIACVEDFYKYNVNLSEKIFDAADNVVEAVLILLQKGAERTSQRQFNMVSDIRKYYPQVYKEHLSRHTQECQEMAKLIRRGIDEGVFREDLNPEIISLVFSKQADTISIDEKLDKFSFAEVFENMVISFLRGICTSKGQEIIEHFEHKNNLNH